MKHLSKSRKTFLGIALFFSIVPLPFAGVIWALIFTKSSFPIEYVAIGTVSGVFASLYGMICIPILWSHQKWGQIKITLFVFLLINLGWLPIIWYRNYSTRPYQREELTFKQVAPPKANVSGMWQGSWTNPKSSLTESVILDLQQDGNQIDGTIMVDSVIRFKITDGLISGDQINLYYDFSTPEFSRNNGVGTLLGRVKNEQISGTWHAHRRPNLGQSRDGPWSISKAVKKP